MSRMRMFGGSLRAGLIAGLLVAGVGSMAGWSAGAQAPAAAPDAQIQADVNKALDNKHMRGLTGKVQDGVVTLTGTVPTLYEKLDAGKKAQKVHNIVRVDNQIQVAGAEVSDQVLGQKLANKLSINNISVNRTVFEAINVSVQDGVVTLGGFVVQPADKDDAEGIVADAPGAKGLVDKIQVMPLSPNDDNIRRAVYQAIYGYQQFTKYAINPVKPIRILVMNGNVTLVGVVGDQADKDVASLRANGVGGVFKVTNKLQVEGRQE